MGKHFLLFYALLFIPLTTLAEQSIGLKVLNQWRGGWSSFTVMESSKWFPQGGQRTEPQKVEWVLKQQFQKITVRSPGHESYIMQRYNAKEGNYQRWIFDSNGGVAVWHGRWNRKKRTMIWKLDLGGISGMMKDRFVGKDKYASTILITNSTGQVLLNANVIHSRIKSEKN